MGRKKKLIAMEHRKVIWLTGLSGSGKTTIAYSLKARLSSLKLPTILIDGDLMRDALQDPHYGYDRTSRLNGAYKYSRFAKMFVEQNLIVIVATISLFHEVHQWNRNNIPEYYEVFIDSDLNTRKQRDPKKYYQQSDTGELEHLSGVDQIVEYPLSPDLHIVNNGDSSEINTQVQKIIDTLNLPINK